MIDFLIHAPITHFARQTPHRTALSFRGESMSYSSLDIASSQLAHALIQNGLRRQDRVGIYMYKGFDLAVAIYGILKAGGVFVPIDPFIPSKRLAFILSDCNIAHLVSEDSLTCQLSSLSPNTRPRLYGISQETTFPSHSWEEIRTQLKTPPKVRIIDQDLGYIMYTSGSTGNPKGMMHTHHGSVSYARWGALHVGMKAEDRVASHAPLHFDLSIFDFFSTAQVGGTVVLVPEQVTKFPASWTEYIEKENISIVFTVPFTLIEMQQRGVMEQRDLSSLRWILFGGEPYPPKHLRSLMGALPDVRFTNVYGPAEAPSCTCYDVPALTVADDQPIPIGKVSLNSAGLILNDNNQECCDGEPGELCIRSSTLTRGYWNRPDLNARAFHMKESFGPFPHVYYRTGDVVIQKADGLLHYIGRTDRMVKIRGHRVELDEVEAVLAGNEMVSEAAAFTVPVGQGGQEIQSVVTLKDGQTLKPGELMRFIRSMIPAYAVPKEIMVSHTLPRTSSGKIDRKQLSEQKTREY